MIRIMVSLFILGLSFGSGPCLASCGPILISYIAGTRKNVLRSLTAYIMFSLARISVYLGLSLSILFLGRFTLERWLGDFSKYTYILGGVFIVVVGILVALGKKLDFRPCLVLQKKILEYDKKNVFMLGLIIGILPCAPLLSILSYIGLVSKFWLNSLFYAFSFGLGTFISPLIFLTIFAGFIPAFFKYNKTIYYEIFGAVCGLIIIFLGLQLIGGAFK